MNTDVLSTYQSDGYFQSGEETQRINSFDNAAILAAEFAYKYSQSTHGSDAYDALKQQYPNVDVRVDSFVESPQVFGKLADRRMDTYRSSLNDNLSEAEKTQVLEQLDTLETRRRNLQNGLETAVGNYNKQQGSFRSLIVRIGHFCEPQAFLFPRHGNVAEMPDFSECPVANPTESW